MANNIQTEATGSTEPNVVSQPQDPGAATGSTEPNVVSQPQDPGAATGSTEPNVVSQPQDPGTATGSTEPKVVSQPQESRTQETSTTQGKKRARVEDDKPEDPTVSTGPTKPNLVAQDQEASSSKRKKVSKATKVRVDDKEEEEQVDLDDYDGMPDLPVPKSWGPQPIPGLKAPVLSHVMRPSVFPVNYQGQIMDRDDPTLGHVRPTITNPERTKAVLPKRLVEAWSLIDPTLGHHAFVDIVTQTFAEYNDNEPLIRQSWVRGTKHKDDDRALEMARICNNGTIPKGWENAAKTTPFGQLWLEINKKQREDKAARAAAANANAVKRKKPIQLGN